MHCSFHRVFCSLLSALLVSWGLWVLFERIARVYGVFESGLRALLVSCGLGSYMRALLVLWVIWVLFERIARVVGSLFGSCLSASLIFKGSFGIV